MLVLTKSSSCNEDWADDMTLKNRENKDKIEQSSEK